MEDIPVHDKRRLNFSSPSDLEYTLRKFPLDRNFVDWVCRQGYRIVYHSDWKAGEGKIYKFPGKIHLGISGKSTLIDLALAHELIHISVPDERLSSIGYNFLCNHKQLAEYEKIIDKLAEQYAQDIHFINYAKQIIPAKTYCV